MMTFTAEFNSGARATLTVSMRGAQCEWTPDLPRHLSVPDREAMIASYRAWRDDCLQQFAQLHNLTVEKFSVGSVDCIAFRSRSGGRI